MRFDSRTAAITVIVLVIIAVAVVLIGQQKSDMSAREQSERELEEATLRGRSHFSSQRLNDARMEWEESMVKANKLYPKSTYPNGHQNLLAGMTNLGDVYKAQGLFDLADVQYQEALAASKALYPGMHESTIAALHKLASLRSEQKQYVAAETFLKEALVMTKRLHSERHIRVAEELIKLGTFFVMINRLPDAALAFSEAIEIAKQVSPQITLGYQKLAMTYFTMGDAANKRKDYVEAKRYFQKSLAIRLSHFPNDYGWLFTNYSALETVSRILDELSDAAKYRSLALVMAWRQWRKDGTVFELNSLSAQR